MGNRRGTPSQNDGLQVPEGVEAVRGENHDFDLILRRVEVRRQRAFRGRELVDGDALIFVLESCDLNELEDVLALEHGIGKEGPATTNHSLKSFS